MFNSSTLKILMLRSIRTSIDNADFNVIKRFNILHQLGGDPTHDEPHKLYERVRFSSKLINLSSALEVATSNIITMIKASCPDGMSSIEFLTPDVVMLDDRDGNFMRPDPASDTFTVLLYANFRHVMDPMERFWDLCEKHPEHLE